MKFLYKFIILIFIFNVFFKTKANYTKLKLLNVVFRHGDREPKDTRSGDLTIIGRQRAYRLGEALRMKYGDFLGDVYEYSSVYARSTEYARAKMSLQLLLAALYLPRVEHQIWHESLAWQPIPFSYVPVNRDILLFPKSCPRFKRELEKAESSLEFQKLLDPYRDMLNNLTFFTGKVMKNSNDMFELYHNLLATRSMNRLIPEWANDIFPDGALLNGTYLQYDFLKYTDWMRKVNGGTLIRKMIDDMQNKIAKSSKNKRKLFLYSAHELNIVAVLMTLKIWEPHIPNYSSSITVELRSDFDNQYYVRILYNESATSESREMRIPGCPKLCPIARFIELISDQLPAYDEIICDNKPVSFNETTPSA